MKKDDAHTISRLENRKLKISEEDPSGATYSGCKVIEHPTCVRSIGILFTSTHIFKGLVKANAA